MQSRGVRHLTGSIGLLVRRRGSNLFDELLIRGKFIPCLDKQCVIKAHVITPTCILNLSTAKVECLPPEQWPLGTHKIRGVISKCTKSGSNWFIRKSLRVSHLYSCTICLWAVALNRIL